MCGNPFRNCVDFIHGSRVLRLGRRSVIDKDCGASATDNEIAYEALVSRKIAQDPSTAVNEEEGGLESGRSSRAYDCYRNSQSTLLDLVQFEVARREFQSHC